MRSTQEVKVPSCALVAQVISLWLCFPAHGQLNQNCVVSVLNRTVQVNADGSWLLPNVPANFGLVRARATCVQNGVTTFGQSALFALSKNGTVNLPHIQLGSVSSIPTSVTITSQTATLTQVGATTQLTVKATYASAPTQDITQASTGTLYNVSNPAIATVSANGLVTAVSTGTVVIQAVNEGAQGIISIQVTLAGASHGGVPDTWAIANGLDPNDPSMPSADPDHDGLTNLQEFQAGTDPHNPDTDGDGLTDGQEVLLYHTNPLVADTDGDGVPDGIEVSTGTDPLNPASFNLSKALTSLEVKPTSFVLNVNSLTDLASQQLTVLGHLNDGKTIIDLTSTLKGTNYASSDLTICNFGSPDGNVFAGKDGTCTITITNSGFNVQATGTVHSFSPASLSFLAIPGFANGVAANGNYAYVAAGGSGLQVVDVSNRSVPHIVASLPLAGNSNGIKLLGNRAYIAGGGAGLQVVDVTNPLAPVLLGTLATSGALGVAVRGSTAYIANTSNLILADVTNPASMTQISSLALGGKIQGVDVDAQRKLAVVAAGSSGIEVVDISNPNTPVLRGTASTGDARAVAISGNYAFVADYLNSTTSVNITTPTAPMVLSHITDPNLGGFLQDIVVSGSFALAADVKFVNGIPITDISSPNSLIARAILNFPQRDDNGMGIAADGSYVYLVTEHSNLNKFGTAGDSRLYIGQYLALQDLKGIPPTVSITAPAPGSTLVQGSTVAITVNAVNDVAVAAVNFLVNGQLVFTATAPPYQLNYAIPVTATSLTLGATAVDLGGNVGTAQNVAVTVIPDPGTTVVGNTVDATNQPVVASVNCMSWVGLPALPPTTTGPGGAFFFSGVPTNKGNIQCHATGVSANNTQIRGVSASVAPVVGGTTNVGNIRLTGGGGKIALIHCDQTANIRNALVATGLIALADLTDISACGAPPTLATLSSFGAVLVWSNFSFTQPDALGNVLADFVDQGGGVVLATYSFSQTWRIGGRILTNGYSPFTVGPSICPPGLLSLATSNTGHPIMQGVTAGPYFANCNYSNPPLTAGGVVIAVDTAGNRAVAVSPSNRVVGVSIFPGFGDMGRLFANALNFLR